MLPRLVVVCLLLALCANRAAAQRNAAPPDSVLLALCPYDSLVVTRLEFAGNKLTQEYIIRAELDLTEGEVVQLFELGTRLEQNRLRLENLQLFHSARVDILSCEAGRLELRFTVQERWYVWPKPIFVLADRNLNVWIRNPNFQRIDYGVSIRHYNFRGRNEKLRLKLQHGFNRIYELNYSLPRLIQAPKWGLFTSFLFHQSHFVDFKTERNSILTYRDEHDFPTRYFHLQGGATYRKNSNLLYQAAVTYSQQRISDSVFFRNPAFLLGSPHRRQLHLEVARTLNLRNTFSYPLSGHFFRVMARQSFPLGGGANYLTLLSGRYAWYQPLGRGFYYATSLEAETKLSHRIAYADNRALGYNTVVRGYELRVADGQHFGLLKQGLSLALLRNRFVHLKFLNNPRFDLIPVSVFLNGFFDVGYVHDDFYLETNQRTSNRLLAGTGLGLHIVTYYDRVFTMEYSLNRDRERGFFIRTAFPI